MHQMLGLGHLSLLWSRCRNGRTPGLPVSGTWTGSEEDMVWTQRYNQSLHLWNFFEKIGMVICLPPAENERKHLSVFAFVHGLVTEMCSWCTRCRSVGRVRRPIVCSWTLVEMTSLKCSTLRCLRMYQSTRDLANRCWDWEPSPQANHLSERINSDWSLLPDTSVLAPTLSLIRLLQSATTTPTTTTTVQICFCLTSSFSGVRLT